jgi:hypothetical protein
MSHTIVLVQFSQNKNSRTYADYPTIPKAMDGIVKLYEARLKELNPRMGNITYDVKHLVAYIDQLPDLSALVLDKKTRQYKPHGKDWIKKKVFTQLQQMAR